MQIELKAYSLFNYSVTALNSIQRISHRRNTVLSDSDAQNSKNNEPSLKHYEQNVSLL